jgi:AraC family transcriptional regulator
MRHLNAAAILQAPPDPGSESGQSVCSGAEVYLHKLVGAGGNEVEALTCGKGRVSVYAAIYASQPYALSVPALAVPRLAVNLTAARVSGGLDNDSPRGFDARRHSLFLTPAGAPVTWRKDSPSRHLGIYFHPDVFDSADEGTPLRCELPCLLNVSIPGIGQLADQLVDELQSSGILKAEAADSLARLVLIRLARRFHRASSAAPALTPKAIERLTDYVVAHLSERILVADLAGQVGLSPNHFAASFTERTGRSPHRFVLAIRIERATTLLGRSTLSLAQIAHDCGFSSQQHLSNVFRQHLGTTPSRLRAGARPAPAR